MQSNEYIRIISNRKSVDIYKNSILYVVSRIKTIDVHTSTGRVYSSQLPYWKMCQLLGDDFVEVQRGCAVFWGAINKIGDKIYLVNGEELHYTIRNKKKIVELLGSNPDIHIKKTFRGVYQIMNPFEFDNLYIVNNQYYDLKDRIDNTEDSSGEQEPKEYLTVIVDTIEKAIDINTIIYVDFFDSFSYIHTNDGKTYKVKTTLKYIENHIGNYYIKICRNAIVSVRAIDKISDRVYLANGVSLPYALYRKKEIKQLYVMKQKRLIESFGDYDIPQSYQEYREHYRVFDNMPFAYADIEMIFDDNLQAVDWIFCYGNPALARLEKIPLEALIGSTFGSLFHNMDSKWLISYKLAALYGETIELIDYSPEIDTYLKIICFPTFKGHCGCILFDINDIKFNKASEDADKALKMYLS